MSTKPTKEDIKDDRKGPMKDEDTEDVVERVKNIGRGEQKGYFVVVAMTQEPDGLECECAAKKTNTNTHDVLRTFYNTMGITKKDRALFDALEDLD